MKKKLCLLALLLAAGASWQPSKAQAVVFDSVPAEGIWLDSGWRYNLADQEAFAQPGYPDTAWKPFLASDRIAEHPEFKDLRIGWLRFHLRIKDTLSARKILLMRVWQFCASEIYLDGKLLLRCGQLGSGRSGVVAENHPVPIEVAFSSNSEHVIAVRFAIPASTFLFRNTSNLTVLNLVDVTAYRLWMEDEKQYVLIYGSLSAIFFLLSVLHIAFYWYNRTQRANIFFAIYTALSGLAFLTITWQMNIVNSFLYQANFVIANALLFIIGIYIVKALQVLFHYRNKVMMVVLWAIYLSCTLAYSFLLRPSAGRYFAYAATIAPVVIQLWLTFRALKERKRGATIIASGFAVSLIAILLVFFIIVFKWQVSELWLRILYSTTYLAAALGISLYLAREFGLDSQLLQQKLRQVEELSAQSLRQEQEKQQLLAEQNDELEKQVAIRTAELASSLADLKSTQRQLIQSEKMASLGELTAGIAHEIQNPLNFVNNFSEVSSELIGELKQEAGAGNTEEVISIADNLNENLKKIAHHGKRADAIVKSMLQHSRAGTGKKEPADINALADEYLRLAYHGFRAKDKNFHAETVTHFSEGLPRINIIAQDIGRVLLNLFNNALYAIQQRSRQEAGSYRPIVSVSTRLADGMAEIVVEDNGVGIPEAIKDKILQPFFTTKPTGEGTGLGLSLSYDIVVKAHNGRLRAESTEGEGTRFIIQLPV